jgi:hypothetical protein
MRVLSVLLLIAASTMCADAYYWGYYYPYSFSYYPYYSLYGGYGWGGWYGKRGDVPSDMPKQTDCVLVKNDNTFKCTGPLGEVECDAEWKWDESIKLEMFAIGKPTDFEVAKWFKLFPRKLDNSGWISNVVKAKGEEFNVTLHQGETHDFGLTVKEENCFKKIVDLLKDSKRNEKIWLEDTETSEQIIGDFSLVIRAKRSAGKYSDNDISERDGENTGEKKHHGIKHVTPSNIN